jgi:hypothetical protein
MVIDITFSEYTLNKQMKERSDQDAYRPTRVRKEEFIEME